MLKKSILELKGIGKIKATRLNKMGIENLKDLIYYFPRTYEKHENVKSLKELESGQRAVFYGKIKGFNLLKSRNKIKILQILFKMDSGEYISVVAFNQIYISKIFKIEDRVKIFGEYQNEKFNPQVRVLEIKKILDEKKEDEIQPIYKLTSGITNNEIRKSIKENWTNIKEYLPNEVIENQKLCDVNYFLKSIHFPKSKEELKIALFRGIFEEFFLLQCGLLYFKNRNKNEIGISFKKGNKIKDFIKSLPFELTKSQLKVIDEILADMSFDVPMNRLVQGDVGSGKTIVALVSILNAVENGYQAVYLAPTEILARQHFESFKKLLKKENINVEMLIGGFSKKKKDNLIFNLENKNINILISTHAVLEENIKFNNLGLVVTDEQHRFGVKQRSKLESKSKSPDVLVMTATPIPRTLSLICHKDLKVSIIDQLPSGRKPIETIAIPKMNRKIAYEEVIKEVKKNHQAYVVCPLVEESDKMEVESVEECFKRLKENELNGLKIAVLHGKMKTVEKEKIMNDFKENKIQVLVSTTVIEVGVDVSNATIMVIENSERFGLAQLHQLRGRVGRSNIQSYCMLVYDSETEIAKKRMEIMETSNDGFYISQKDLEIRGSGEILGFKQHGSMEFKLADFFKHKKILEIAQEEVEKILKDDPILIKKENQNLKNEIESRFVDTFNEVAMN